MSVYEGKRRCAKCGSEEVAVTKTFEHSLWFLPTGKTLEHDCPRCRARFRTETDLKKFCMALAGLFAIALPVGGLATATELPFQMAMVLVGILVFLATFGVSVLRYHKAESNPLISPKS